MGGETSVYNVFQTILSILRLWFIQAITYRQGGGGVFAGHAGGTGGGLWAPVSLLEGGDGGRELPSHLQIDDKMGIIQIYVCSSLSSKGCGSLTS